VEDILGIICAFASPFGYKISDSDIGYFAILQQMSGFADRIFEYFAILQQMSGFVGRIFGYFVILLQVQVPGTGTDTSNDFISGYLADIWRKNIEYFQP
jgi:hypothetical protein